MSLVEIENKGLRNPDIKVAVSPTTFEDKEKVKQIEDILKESEDPYESFVNTFGIGSFIYNPELHTFEVF